MTAPKSTVAKRYTAALIAQEKQKTQAMIKVIEASKALIDDEEYDHIRTFRAGKFTLRLAPKAGRADKMIATLNGIRKPVARRVAGTRYPTFSAGMSTQDYVEQFAMRNHDQWANSYEGIKAVIKDFFEPLNVNPCALYENGALDFDAMEENEAAAAAVAAVVATAQALANAAAAPAQDTAEHAQELATVCAMDDGAHTGAAPAMGSTSTGGPGYTSPPATLGAAAFLHDIPATLARSAFAGTSFSPERRGDSTRNEFAGTLSDDYADFYTQAVKGGTLDKLQAEFARYRAGMASRYRDYLASSSRCVSSFIAGPANFPAARMNKRADIAHRRLGDYLDGRESARRAVVRNLRPDLRPIMSGDADAAERLAVELAQLVRRQARMKAANMAIRKNAKAGEAHQLAALMELGYAEQGAAGVLHRGVRGCGFQPYELTNNGANIRRISARLEHIEAAQAKPVTEATGADGVRLEDDAPANRVRLFFPGKPADQIREELKKNGFRWSPKSGAWQAYRNSWSVDTARKMVGLQQAPAATAPALAEPPAPAVSVQAPAPAPAVSVQAPAPAPAVSVQAPAPAPAVSVQAPAPAPAVSVQAPAPAPAVSVQPAKKANRRFVPAVGARLASKSGAWEAWFYTRLGRPCLAFYQGAAFKPTGHFHFKNDAARMQTMQRLAKTADAVLAIRATRAATKRAELAKPHGLKVGAVLVHSWGYEQTNIDYYQVTQLIGRRMVEMRSIAAERHYSGDMSGQCVPCPGQFKGAAMRAQVGTGDQVRVAGHSRGHASPLEIVGTLPGGAPIYRRHGCSEYA